MVVLCPLKFRKHEETMIDSIRCNIVSPTTLLRLANIPICKQTDGCICDDQEMWRAMKKDI